MKKSTIIGVTALTCAIIAVPMAASAANGGAWLLGRSNSESATTTVTNNYGTALSLNSKAGTAPLKVNRTTKVTNLNSDLVDGYSAASFAMRTGKTGTIVADTNITGWGAKCPTGTVFVSGGGAVQYMGDVMQYSGPDWDYTTNKVIPNSWIVIGQDAYGNFSYGRSYVTCYQPSGAAIPGAATTYQQLFPQSSALAAPATKGSPGFAKLEQFKAQVIGSKDASAAPAAK